MSISSDTIRNCLARVLPVLGMILPGVIRARADPRPGPDSLAILHYTFRLSLYDTTDCITGLARLKILNPDTRARHLDLDLDGMHAGTGKGMAVEWISCQGQRLSYIQDSGKLDIDLAGISKDTVHLDIAYRGIPRDGLIISRNKFGKKVFFGDNWPNRAHDWLPVIDRPSAKAPVDFIVLAPLRDQVVSNGRLVERSNLGDGRMLTHWKESVPITPYLMVIGVAPFAVQYLAPVHGIPVESWVYPQDRSKGFADFAQAEKVLSLYERYLGPFPFEKLADVESTTRFGGMENASCIFYDEKEVTGRQLNEVIIAHEIAHQWFGDDVTEADWHDIWLSEGFATFFEDFYIGKEFGADSLAAVLRKDKKRVFAWYRRKPSPVVDTSITRLENLLNANSYQKGGYVLRMLKHLLGSKLFWAGMQHYYRKYRHGSALTIDFERSMEQVAHISLSWFFREWIYRPGYPVLAWNWKFSTPGRTLTFHLRQVQQEQVFRMPVDFCFYLKGGKIVHRVLNMDKADQQVNFPLRERPDSVALDPGQYILMESRYCRILPERHPALHSGRHLPSR